MRLGFHGPMMWGRSSKDARIRIKLNGWTQKMVINMIVFIKIRGLEHFVVWMRTAGLPDFRKLWGKIESDLSAGDYNLTISNSIVLGSL